MLPNACNFILLNLSLLMFSIEHSYRYERTQLASLLAENAVLVPCRAALRGVGVNLPVRSSNLFKDQEALIHLKQCTRFCIRSITCSDPYIFGIIAYFFS